MAGYFISSPDLEKFAAGLISNADVYAPVMIENRPRLKKIGPSLISSINLASYRTPEPVKALFLKADEAVSAYFSGKTQVGEQPKKKIIFLKSCDLSALFFEDRFFGEETADPFYFKDRNNTVLIGSDCGDALPTCHCTMMGVKPYAERYFDMNMSAVDGGFAVDVASGDGRALIDLDPGLFKEISQEQRNSQAVNRAAIMSKVMGINRKYNFKAKLEDIIKFGLENNVWRDITKMCTECGACNMSCPTCTCFLLYDEKGEKGFTRGKEWDTCMKMGYARVAGGANTRPLLHGRTQNRWQCKFDYMFDKYGIYACSGCGRCTEVCMAKIDMRETFLMLREQALLGLKLE